MINEVEAKVLDAYANVGKVEVIHDVEANVDEAYE